MKSDSSLGAKGAAQPEAWGRASGIVQLENGYSDSPLPGGGGIYNSSATLTITNSTVSGNSATSGGGIVNEGSDFQGGPTLRIVSNSTLSGNSADSGGGIYNYYGSLYSSDSILNAGASGENIYNYYGPVTSLGYNLSSDDGGGYLTGPGDQINTDPMLGPLQDNGGPTFTHALLPGSPAIDAGNPNFTPPTFLRPARIRV
jgi:hypothetical protein